METFKLIFPLAWRNLWRNKRRSILTMMAIFVAVTSMVSLGAFMRAWADASLIETINNLTGHGQVHAQKYLDDPNIEHRIHQIPQALLARLEQPPVTHFSERVRVPAMLRTERESAPVELLGIQPQKEVGLSFINGAIRQGRYLSDDSDGGLILGAQLVDRLQTALGRRLVVMSQGNDGSIRERGYRIVGVFEGQPALEKSLAFVSIESAQSLLEIDQDISEIAFRVEDLSQVDAFIKELKNYAENLQVSAWDELEPFAKALIEMSDGSILIWILVSFTVVSFGLVNTLLMAVYERMREFGLLQALGMKPRWLLMQILIESVFMVGVANLLGLIAGSLIVLSFADGLNLGIGASYFGSAQIVYPRVDSVEVSMIGIVVLILGLLASLYPAVHAARDVPVDVLSRATN